MSSVSQATSVPSLPPDTVHMLGLRMQADKLLLRCSIFAPIACSLVHAALRTGGLSGKPAQGTESCLKNLFFLLGSLQTELIWCFV